MNNNNQEIKFANISVTFEEFVDVLASKVALRMYQIEKGQLEISQAKAFKMFGRADVERWVKSGKLTPCRISPGKKRYKLADLQKLVENFADLVRWQLQKVDPHIGAVA